MVHMPHVPWADGKTVPGARTDSVLLAPGERYYLLVASRGVYRFDGNFARRVSRSGLFPEDDVSAIAVDTYENLWAAGRFGGIAVYQNDHWTKIAEGDQSIWQQQWRTAKADNRGGVFFGSASGAVVGIENSLVRNIAVPGELSFRPAVAKVLEADDDSQLEALMQVERAALLATVSVELALPPLPRPSPPPPVAPAARSRTQ